MDAPVACPKCSGPMKPGFAVDHGHLNLSTIGEWATGQPLKGGWGGLKMPAGKRFQIRGVRCEQCGYVELYANRPPGRV